MCLMIVQKKKMYKNIKEIQVIQNNQFNFSILILRDSNHIFLFRNPKLELP